MDDPTYLATLLVQSLSQPLELLIFIAVLLALFWVGAQCLHKPHYQQVQSLYQVIAIFQSQLMDVLLVLELM